MFLRFLRRSGLVVVTTALFVSASPAFGGVWFTPVAGPPDALVISSVAVGTYSLPHTLNIPYGLFAVPGRGMFTLGSTQYLTAPCADAQIVTVGGLLGFRAWTSCGLFEVGGGFVSPTWPGLDSRSQVSALMGDYVGFAKGGVGRFIYGTAGGVFISLNGGLALTPGTSVRAFGFAAGQIYVSLSGGSLYGGGGLGWQDASNGLPIGSTVAAVGGSSTAFAMVDGNGVWRRLATGSWRRESNGAGSAVVKAFAGSFAAAGTAGVLRHVNGSWMPETSGLPPRTDANAIGLAMSGSDRKIEDLYLGTNGQGLFHAISSPTVRVLPAIVDTVGTTGQRFRTEITIGNVGVLSSMPLSLNPAGDSINLNLPIGTELRASDAFAWLRSQGLAIAAGTAVTSLATGFSSPDVGIAPAGVYMLARVYTTDPSGGTYGVMLEAPTDIDGAEEEASVYGLRSAAGVDRSNLAVSHMASAFRDSLPITLSVRIFSADGSVAPNVLTRTLARGEFFQWNDVLLLAGLPQGSAGYARISRTAGIGAWTGYGVVNDAATSDGALLPLYRPGGLAATRRLLVPVVLDAYGAAESHYTTELTLVNDGVRPSTASLFYHAAPGHGAPLSAPAVAVPVGAGAQVTLPDTVAFLRAHGVAIPDPLTAGSQAGSLEVVFQGLDGDDVSRTVALARTTTPNPNRETGGRFGVSYSAIAWGGGATQPVLVPALAQDAASRSNLAVINAGGGSEGAITLSVQLRDADNGSDVGVPLLVTLNPGEWYQWDRVIERAGAATSKAIATVTRISGDDTFFAYGVVNDAKTSDGSFIRMIRLDGE